LSGHVAILNFPSLFFLRVPPTRRRVLVYLSFPASFPGSERLELVPTQAPTRSLSAFFSCCFPLLFRCPLCPFFSLLIPYALCRFTLSGWIFPICLLVLPLFYPAQIVVPIKGFLPVVLQVFWSSSETRSNTPDRLPFLLFPFFFEGLPSSAREPRLGRSVIFLLVASSPPFLFLKQRSLFSDRPSLLYFNPSLFAVIFLPGVRLAVFFSPPSNTPRRGHPLVVGLFFLCPPALLRLFLAMFLCPTRRCFC